MSNPFEIKNGVLTGNRGRVIVDELDIPSPHTRRYQRMEMAIHSMSDDQAVHFATQLRQDIHHFDASDTLDAARSQGRLAYRSWPQSPTASSVVVGGAGSYTSGFSSLTTSRDAVALRQAQRDFQLGATHDPFTSAPSTVLGRDDMHEEALWSGAGPGMVTALLPEHHYVAMDALNRRAQHATASPALRDANETLRSEVTHPHLMDNIDLSSMVMTMGTGTERRGKPSMKSNNPGADFKLRENATRYQSFMNAHGAEQTEIHNEMAIHYRGTGQSTAATEMNTRMIQPTIKLPDTTVFGVVIKRGATVPDMSAPMIRLVQQEDSTRDTRALSTVLNQPHAPYPVLKK
jgi:hypothetical protein